MSDFFDWGDSSEDTSSEQGLDNNPAHSSITSDLWGEDDSPSSSGDSNDIFDWGDKSDSSENSNKSSEDEDDYWSRQESFKDGVSHKDSSSEGFDWGSTESSEPKEPQQSANQQSTFQMKVPEVRMGYKRVGIILAVGFIFCALLLLCLKSCNTGQSTQTYSENSQGNESGQEISSSNSTSSNYLEEISGSSKYESSEKYEANGTISEKKMYKQGNQIVYCLVIELVWGSKKEYVNYYCSASAYYRTGINSSVQVTYQQPELNTICIYQVTIE